jgi:hypothetical protein
VGKRESGIQTSICEEIVGIYGLNVWVRVKHGDGYAVVGDPDLYGCLYGRFFAFEVKNEDNELTKIQRHRLQELRRAGAVVAGVRSVREAMQMLDQHIIAVIERPDWRM